MCIRDRFWYCEPNCCHDNLLPESESTERIIYDSLCGYPEDLIRLSSVVAEVKEFISNGRLWCSGDVNIDDIDCLLYTSTRWMMKMQSI